VSTPLDDQGYSKQPVTAGRYGPVEIPESPRQSGYPNDLRDLGNAPAVDQVQDKTDAPTIQSQPARHPKKASRRESTWQFLSGRRREFKKPDDGKWLNPSSIYRDQPHLSLNHGGYFGQPILAKDKHAKESLAALAHVTHCLGN